jgi:predicted N-acetyltransferase YhbS
MRSDSTSTHPQPDQEVYLREATEDDVSALLSLMQTAFEEYRGRLDPPSGVHSETLESIREKLQLGHAVFASVGGEVVGCVFYKPEGLGLYLGRLSVLPKWRGRGIGRALTQYVEGRARELEVGYVQLGVRTSLRGLRQYYERQGYRFVRYESHEGYSEPTSAVLEKAMSESRA